MATTAKNTKTSGKRTTSAALPAALAKRGTAAAAGKRALLLGAASRTRRPASFAPSGSRYLAARASRGASANQLLGAATGFSCGHEESLDRR